MDKIGTGFRMVGDKLLVKLCIVPEENTKVYAEDGKEIGKLVDIIGSVDYPFGVVAKSSNEDYQGKIISVKEGGTKK
jgi:rRNA processing protein Gar1